MCYDVFCYRLKFWKVCLAHHKYQKFVAVSRSCNENIHRYTETCLQRHTRCTYNKHTDNLCFYVSINSKFEIMLSFDWVVLIFDCIALDWKIRDWTWNKLKCNTMNWTNNYFFSINNNIISALFCLILNI